LEPRGQKTHFLESIVNEPELQPSQTLEPLELANVPVGHPEHIALPESLEKVPGLQKIHDEALIPEYDPGLHTLHEDAFHPANEPLTHCMHPDLLAIGILPRSQYAQRF
jgi:hypothetical protein